MWCKSSPPDRKAQPVRWEILVLPDLTSASLVPRDQQALEAPQVQQMAQPALLAQLAPESAPQALPDRLARQVQVVPPAQDPLGPLVLALARLGPLAQLERRRARLVRQAQGEAVATRSGY